MSLALKENRNDRIVIKARCGHICLRQSLDPVQTNRHISDKNSRTSTDSQLCRIFALQCCVAYMISRVLIRVSTVGRVLPPEFS